MRLVSLSIIIILFYSCSKEKNASQLVLNGQIKGLKVGTVYLQSIQDTSLVTLDSIAIDGSSDKFKLRAAIDQPQLMYLSLDVNDGVEYDDRIAFFAQDTIMTFNSTLDDFEKKAHFTGSKNQIAYKEFMNNKKKLDQLYTDLVKRSMQLQQDANIEQKAVDKLTGDYDRYIKRKVQYTVNYANNNSELALAPYLLLQELDNANPVWLDSIYRKMPKKIQTSLYGKKLSEFLENNRR